MKSLSNPCARMVLRFACVIAAMCCSLLWAGGSMPISAQEKPATATPTPPKFEVATIKRSAPGTTQTGTVFQPGGWYRASNVRLRDLVSEAYRVRGFQVVGGPAWVASDRFDIEAKSEDPNNFAPVPKADGTRTISGDPFRMLRELVAERFKLVVHRETRDGPVYALIMSRSGRRGPGLRPFAVNCAALDPKNPTPGVGICGGIAMARGRFTAKTATMPQLATSLSIVLQRPVLDRTGLSEPFDFDLEWAPINVDIDVAAAPVSEFAPSLLAALDEQLGLKLDAQRAPIEYVVIDSAEPPSDN